jgi:hypothetical protein
MNGEWGYWTSITPLHIVQAHAMRQRFLAVLIAFVLLPSLGATQGTVPSWRARLLGVYNANTGDPLEGAEVGDILAKVTALTTTTGTVSLVFLPEGGTLVRIRKVGFEPTTMMVAISPDDTVPLTVLLKPSAQTLPTVVTTDSARTRYLSPALRAFDERRLSGQGGHFVVEAELRKNDHQPLTNVVRRLPGLQIKCVNRGSRRGECYATSFRQKSGQAMSGGECPVDVYLNGAAATDNDLQKMQTLDFAGVEYYGGGATIPAQYNRTGSSCGVLLLWLRER